MDDVVIAVITLGFFIILFAFIGLMRFVSYRETMGLAEKGLVRGDLRRNGGKDTLRWGIVITSVGLALCIGLYPIGFASGSRWLFGLGPWMLAGLLPTFFGLGLVLIYALTKEKDEAPQGKDESGRLPPVRSRGPADEG
jgi:hypothetical protein